MLKIEPTDRSVKTYLVSNGDQEVMKSSRPGEVEIGSSNWSEYPPYIGPNYDNPPSREEIAQIKKNVEKTILDLI